MGRWRHFLGPTGSVSKVEIPSRRTVHRFGRKVRRSAGGAAQSAHRLECIAGQSVQCAALQSAGPASAPQAEPAARRARPLRPVAPPDARTGGRVVNKPAPLLCFIAGNNLHRPAPSRAKLQIEQEPLASAPFSGISLPPTGRQQRARLSRATAWTGISNKCLASAQGENLIWNAARASSRPPPRRRVADLPLAAGLDAARPDPSEPSRPFRLAQG